MKPSVTKMSSCSRDIYLLCMKGSRSVIILRVVKQVNFMKNDFIGCHE